MLLLNAMKFTHTCPYAQIVNTAFSLPVSRVKYEAFQTRNACVYSEGFSTKRTAEVNA